MIRVADYIIKRIYEEGVGHIFYVPGGQCVYLMDAVRRSDIVGIGHHHEQAAAMAALSYSQYTENFGACLVTTGCAGTNTMTGVLHAWQDSIPCIFISGQQPVEQTIEYSGLHLRQVGIQEANIVELVSPITKYACMIKNMDEVVWQVDKAIYEAKHGRKGPVWLDVPLNIQNSMIDEEKQERYIGKEEELVISEDDIKYVKEALNTSERPIIIAGMGVRSGQAVDSMRILIEKWRIPCVFTRSASDIIEYDHEMNIGIFGATGATRSANFAVQNSDLVINIGCRLSIDTTGPAVDKFARAAKVVVVDIDATEHSKKGVKIDKFIHGTALDFISAMLKDETTYDKEAWLKKCNGWKIKFRPYSDEAKVSNPINLMYFLESLSKVLPENSAVLSDAGMTGVAVPTNCHLKRGDRIIHSFAQGEMGYALPGAIGVACATDGMTFSISGDGSFMMNMQELQTIVRNQLNIKIIINNNNGYSGVRHGQKAHFRGKSIGTDPSNGLDFPVFENVASAFGLKYIKIDDVKDIESKLQLLVNNNEPVVCEVFTDEEQFDLHTALVSYGKRKFGFRPLEDQSPFLDRDVFFEEMIVEPDETSYGQPM